MNFVLPSALNFDISASGEVLVRPWISSRQLTKGDQKVTILSYDKESGQCIGTVVAYINVWANETYRFEGSFDVVLLGPN
jgi:hypothetical protein